VLSNNYNGGIEIGDSEKFCECYLIITMAALSSTTASSKLHVKTLPSTELSESALKMRAFSPYVNNGGTAMAVSGPDYAIIGGDTRMSTGYSICSRDVPKVFQITEKCVLATSGMQAESQTLRKVLHAKATQYEQKHSKKLSAPSVAQMLSNTLYYKRFFPYYTFNVLAGIDNEGKGAAWGYDAVGSFERVPYVCTGTGSALVTSILDNQIGNKTQDFNPADDAKRIPKTLDEALKIVKDAFISAGERDIYTGDYVDLAIITRTGVRYERFDLKKD